MTVLAPSRRHGPQIPTPLPTKLAVTRVPLTRPQTPVEQAVKALQAGDPKTAVRILRPIAERDPRNAEVRQILGTAYHAQGKWDSAIAHMEASLDRVDAPWQWWQNLGIAYQSTGRFADDERGMGAVSAFEQAVERAPREADPIHNLGTAYVAVNRHDAAERALVKARTLRDTYASTHFNLGCLYLILGEVQKATRCFGQACDRDRSHQLAHANLIFCRDLLPETTAALARAERRSWNSRHAAALTAAAPPHMNDRNPDRRLRVGYTGGDFRDHSAMYSFGPILERHDPERIEVFVYAESPESDQYTERMRRAATGGFRSVHGLDDAHIAGLIRQDRIDVLVELAGYTARHKLLAMARKPAPVQLTGWGYLSGTGLDAIDGVLVDEILVPPGDERYFTEQPVYVPHPVGFERPPDDLEILPRDPAAAPTFGVLGRIAKVSEAALDLWADVLKAAPESRLLLKDRGYDPERARVRIVKAFAARGIDPSRVEMRGTTTRGEHMLAYNEVDVALDPIPQGGGMTTLEALYMGVPTVAMYGDRIVGRVSASHLAKLPIGPSHIAYSHDEYVALAVAALARRDKGPHLREMLMSSVICDHETNVRAIEDGYRMMFREWCERGPWG